jgi:membrane protease YdiL (CAAX protease family)
MNPNKTIIKNKSVQLVIIVSIIVACCTIMGIVDAIIKPNYAVKSTIKIILFLGCPLIYSHLVNNISLKKLFYFEKRGFFTSLLMGIGVFSVILTAYFSLRNLLDLSQITVSLESNIGVSKDNFVFVSLYISFVNSLLEEFFFRGFAFLSLKKFTSRFAAYGISSIAFALYHIAMMIGWFSMGTFVLTIIGLIAGGVIFNFLNEKNENIYSSWMVHMFANFAINVVGFILFGVL